MHDPWHDLRRFTQARIAQGRVGCGLPTSALLDFQLAHAAARDAVLQGWDVGGFAAGLARQGLASLCLETQVADRFDYLQRPDKGRRLADASCELLRQHAGTAADVALILSNGLSSTAVNIHGLALLAEIVAVFRQGSLSISDICLVPNARVAVADQIGSLLNARLSMIIIGERPGLSAADSLGVYLTYAPKIGNTDAERNCLSNIRPPEGLGYRAAADKLHYLSRQALRLGLSGVGLKDDMPRLLL